MIALYIILGIVGIIVLVILFLVIVMASQHRVEKQKRKEYYDSLKKNNKSV